MLAAVGCRGGSGPAPADPPPPTTVRAGADAAAGARPVRALTPAALDAIAAIAVPGHEVHVVARGAGDVALAITAAAGTRAILTASRCLGCVAPELPAWHARRATLAALWAPGAESEPPVNEARLALAALPLAGGAHAIAIDARRADGSIVTIAHWNDGATQLQAVCELPAPPSDPCTAILAPALDAALAALASPAAPAP